MVSRYARSDDYLPTRLCPSQKNGQKLRGASSETRATVACFVSCKRRSSLGSRRLERCGFGIHRLWFRSSVGRLIAGPSCSVAQILGSVLLIAGYVAGLYVASVAMALSFAIFISGAWLLITGIHNKQD
jgi:hypothetical protein